MTHDRETQGVLFSGMDCLPGQRDLFETDGQPEVADGQAVAPDLLDTLQIIARGCCEEMRCGDVCGCNSCLARAVIAKTEPA